MKKMTNLFIMTAVFCPNLYPDPVWVGKNDALTIENKTEEELEIGRPSNLRDVSYYFNDPEDPDIGIPAPNPRLQPGKKWQYNLGGILAGLKADEFGGLLYMYAPFIDAENVFNFSMVTRDGKYTPGRDDKGVVIDNGTLSIIPWWDQDATTRRSVCVMRAHKPSVVVPYEQWKKENEKVVDTVPVEPAVVRRGLLATVLGGYWSK